MAFSPDGNLLASGDAKGCLNIWDLAEGKRVSSMPAHRAPLWSLSFSSGEGCMLASGACLYTYVLGSFEREKEKFGNPSRSMLRAGALLEGWR